MATIEGFGANFALSDRIPLDARHVVVDITNVSASFLATAYVGMITYDEATSTHYEITANDGTSEGLIYEEFSGSGGNSGAGNESVENLLTASMRRMTNDISYNINTSAMPIYFMPPADRLHIDGAENSTVIGSAMDGQGVSIRLQPGRYTLGTTVSLAGMGNGALAAFRLKVYDVTNAAILNMIDDEESEETHLVSGPGGTATISETFILDTERDITVMLDADTTSTATAVTISMTSFTVYQLSAFSRVIVPVATNFSGAGSPLLNDDIAKASTDSKLVENAIYREDGEGMWLCTGTAGSHGTWERLLVASDMASGALGYLATNGPTSWVGSQNIANEAYDLRLMSHATQFNGTADFLAGCSGGDFAGLNNSVTLPPGRYQANYVLGLGAVANTAVMALSLGLGNADTGEYLSGKARGDTVQEYTSNNGTMRHVAKSEVFELDVETAVQLIVSGDASSTGDTSISLRLTSLSLVQLNTANMAVTEVVTTFKGNGQPSDSQTVQDAKTAGSLEINSMYTQKDALGGTGLWICTGLDGTHGQWDRFLTANEGVVHNMGWQQTRQSLTQFLNFQTANIAATFDFWPGPGRSTGDADTLAKVTGNTSRGDTNFITLPAGRYNATWSINFTAAGATSTVAFSSGVINMDTGEYVSGRTSNDGGELYNSLSVQQGMGYFSETFVLAEETKIQCRLQGDPTSGDNQIHVRCGQLSLLQLQSTIVGTTQALPVILEGNGAPTASAVVAEAAADGSLVISSTYNQLDALGSGLWICTGTTGSHGAWERAIVRSDLETSALSYLHQITRSAAHFNFPMNNDSVRGSFFPTAASCTGSAGLLDNISGTAADGLDNTITLQPGRYQVAARVMFGTIDDGVNLAIVMGMADTNELTGFLSGRESTNTEMMSLTDTGPTRVFDHYEVIEVPVETTASLVIQGHATTGDSTVAVTIEQVNITQVSDVAYAIAALPTTLEGNGVPTASAVVAAAKTANGLTANSSYTQLDAVGSGLWICTGITGSHGTWEKLITSTEVEAEDLWYLNATVRSTRTTGINMSDHSGFFKCWPRAVDVVGTTAATEAIVGTNEAAQDNRMTLPAGRYQVAATVRASNTTTGSFLAYTMGVMNFSNDTFVGGRDTAETLEQSSDISHNVRMLNHVEVFELTETTHVCIGIQGDTNGQNQDVTLELIKFNFVQLSKQQVGVSAPTVVVNDNGIPANSIKISDAKTAGLLTVNSTYRQDDAVGSGLWICISTDGPNGQWEKVVTSSDLNTESLWYLKTNAGCSNFGSVNLDQTGIVASGWPRADRWNGTQEALDAITGTAGDYQGNSITLPPGRYMATGTLTLGGIVGGSRLGLTMLFVDDAGVPINGHEVTDTTAVYENESGELRTYRATDVIDLTVETTVRWGVIGDTSNEDSDVTLRFTEFTLVQLNNSAVSITPITSNLEGTDLPVRSAVVLDAKARNSLAVNSTYQQTDAVGAGLWICISLEGTHGKWEKIVTETDLRFSEMWYLQSSSTLTTQDSVNIDVTGDVFSGFWLAERLVGSPDALAAINGDEVTGAGNTIDLPIGRYQLNTTVFMWNIATNARLSFTVNVVDTATGNYINGRDISSGNGGKDFSITGSSSSESTTVFDITEPMRVQFTLSGDTSTTDTSISFRFSEMSLIQLHTTAVATTAIATVLEDTGVPTSSTVVRDIHAANNLGIDSTYHETDATGSGLWICVSLAGSHGKWEKVVTKNDITRSELMYLQSNSPAASIGGLNMDHDNLTSTVFYPVERLIGSPGALSQIVGTSDNGLGNYITLRPGRYRVTGSVHFSDVTDNARIGVSFFVLNQHTQVPINGRVIGSTWPYWESQNGPRRNYVYDEIFELTETTDVAIGMQGDASASDNMISTRLNTFSLVQLNASAVALSPVATVFEGDTVPALNNDVKAARSANKLVVNSTYNQTGSADAPFWVCIGLTGSAGEWIELAPKMLTITDGSGAWTELTAQNSGAHNLIRNSNEVRLSAANCSRGRVWKVRNNGLVPMTLVLTGVTLETGSLAAVPAGGSATIVAIADTTVEMY